MSDFLDRYIDQKANAQQSFIGANNGSADDAARAFQLSQASGVPAEIVNQDVQGFDKSYQAQLGGQIIARNPHLTSFVNAHPLHGQLIADDLSVLDSLTRRLDKLNGSSASKEGFKEFGEAWKGFGGPTQEFLQNHFPLAGAISRGIVTAGGLGIESVASAAKGGVGFIHGFGRQYLRDLGFSDQAADKAMNDIAGMAEYELMRPSDKLVGARGREDLRWNPSTGKWGPAEGEVLPPEPKPPEPGGGLRPPGKTIEAEPVDLSRRRFLQGVGATAATAATGKGGEIIGGLAKAAAKPRFSLNAYRLASEYLLGDIDDITGLPEVSDPQWAIIQLQSLGKRVALRINEANRIKEAGGIAPPWAETFGQPEHFNEAIDLIKSGWRPDPYQALVQRTADQVRPFAEAGERPPISGNDPVQNELEQQRAIRNFQEMSDVFDEAETTALKQVAPEKMKELLDHVPNSWIRVPVEEILKVWKPGPGDMFRNVVPALSQRIADGPFGHITMPFNAFVAHIPKEDFKALAENIALGDDLSVREAKELGEIVQGKPVRDKSTPAGEAQEIGNFVASEMARLGRPEEEANREGALWAARYYSRGVRLGISPRTLFEQERLAFEGGEHPFPGRLFNQPMAYHGSPEAADIEKTGPDLTMGGRGLRWMRRNTFFMTPDRTAAQEYGKVIAKDVDLSNAKEYDVRKLVKDPEFISDLKQAFLNAKIDTNIWDILPDTLESWEKEFDETVAPTYLPKGSGALNKWGEDISGMQESGYSDEGGPWIMYTRDLVTAIVNKAREDRADVAIIKGMWDAGVFDQWVILNDRAFTGKEKEAKEPDKNAPQDDAWIKVANEVRTGGDDALKSQFENVLDAVSKGDMNFNEAMIQHGSPKLYDMFKAKSFSQALRGRVTFSRDKTTLQLFSSANATTPIHEFGHLWLDELFRDAMRPGAPDSVINSRDAILQALGKKPGEIVDSLHFTDEMHEQVARWFEQYAMGGKAPSTKLVGVFEGLKKDLLQVYHNAEVLGQPISDEVRGVFDRMLATDIEIRERTKAETAALEAAREAAGLNLDITGYPWAEDLPWTAGQQLEEMVKSNAPWEQYKANPLIQEFMEKQEELKKTAPTKDQARDPAWRAKRSYYFNGKEYKGDEIIPKLIEKSMEDAGGSINYDREMTLVIGPPAAGKSSAVRPMARATKSAVVGADEAKEVIPAYQGGVGVYAAHPESLVLSEQVLKQLMDKGANIIIEKVGNNFDDIIPMMQDWKALGYRVNLIHVHKPLQELIPGMISRFQATGRIVDPEYLAGVADKTYPGYKELKPYADEAAAFDTSGSTPTRPSLKIIDGEGTRIASIVGGDKGGGRDAKPTGSISADGAGAAGPIPEREIPSSGVSFAQPEDSPFRTAAAFGRTTREYRKYQELIAERDAQDVEWRRTRAERQAKLENAAEWKAEAAAIKDDVKQWVMAQPGVQAYSTMEGSGSKFARKSLTPEEIQLLPPKLISQRGAHPDDLANYFGFNSGKELIEEIAQLYNQAEGYKGDIIDRMVAAETYKRVNDKLGQSAEDRLAEVMDHALSLTEMEKLHEQIVALGTRIGASLPLSKAHMQWGARELLLNDTFGGMKSQNYLRESGKAARNLEKALLEDNPLEAFKQAQAQFIAATMAKEAQKVEKEKRSFDKLAKRFAAREVPNFPAEYTNWIHDILMRVGRGVARDPRDLREEISHASDKTLPEFIASKTAMGYDIDVPDFLLDPSFNKALDSMTVLEAQQVMRAVTMLRSAGRQERNVIYKAQRMELDDWLTSAADQLSAMGEAKQLSPGVRKLGRTFLASSLQIESLLNRFDRGNAFGLFNQFISRPLSEAANYEAALDRQIAKMYRELPKLRDLNEGVPNTLFKDPFSAWQHDGKMDWGNARTLQLTRKNMISILLQAGNPDNLERLATGYGLKPQQVMDWLNTYASKEDWDWAQAHGNIFAELKKLSDQMYRRLTGVAPKPIEILPINTPHGQYPGWYHPVIHDEVFPGFIREKISADALMASEYVRASTSAGYAKARTTYRGPLSLDLDAIPGRFFQEIHDIAFREPIVNAAKIIYNNRFKTAVAKYYGKEYADLFEPWLRDVANSANTNSAATQVFERASSFLRQNLIGTLVGMNLRTVEKHTLTAGLLSAREVGLPNFLEALTSLLSRGERDTENNWQFALRKSEELQRRHQNFNEQVRGAQESALRSTVQGTFMTFRQALLHAGTTPVAFFDLLSAVPTWLAAYKTGLEKTGNVGDAVYLADRAVRRAHGSTAMTNRPGVMRGGELGNWMTSLYSFFNRMANAQYELAWRAKISAGFGEGSDAAIKEAVKKDSNLWLGLFTYVIAPAVIEELVTPYTNAEKESWGYSAGKVIARGLASSWVGVRDLVSALVEQKDPTLGMASTDVKEFTDLVRDLQKKSLGMDKERAGKTVKHAITAFGAATGLTNAEEGNLAEFLIDLKSGKAKPKTIGDWWRGLTKGEIRQKEDRPDLVERGLRLTNQDKAYGVKR